MRRPITLAELSQLEQIVHETNLRGEAAIAEWNKRHNTTDTSTSNRSPYDPTIADNLDHTFSNRSK